MSAILSSLDQKLVIDALQLQSRDSTYCSLKEAKETVRPKHEECFAITFSGIEISGKFYCADNINPFHTTPVRMQEGIGTPLPPISLKKLAIILSYHGYP